MQTQQLTTTWDETEGYYDISSEIEVAALGGVRLRSLWDLRNIKQRKFYIGDRYNGLDESFDLNADTVDEMTMHILQINKDDKDIEPEKRKPIIIYLSTHGGDVDEGFKLIDAIQASKTPVYTVNYGYWYSMGFLVGISGHKRFATKNAKFLMHDGVNFIISSGNKTKDIVSFQDDIDSRIKDYTLSVSKITSEEYDEKLRLEWYLFADQAKEKGLVDYIIGEDCDIDEII